MDFFSSLVTLIKKKKKIKNYNNKLNCNYQLIIKFDIIIKNQRY